MSSFIKLHNGEATTAEDPDRGLWYASSMECGYWTDDWSTLRKTGPGIPCCPKCGCVGMQTTARKWFDGAKVYEDQGNPHYMRFVEQDKENCGAKSGMSYSKRYEQFKAAQPAD